MEGFAPSNGGDTIDCMDVMENFGYMDLLDSNEIWDPSCIFDQNPREALQQFDNQSKQLDVQNHQLEQPTPVEFFIQDDGNGNSSSEVVQDDKRPFNEMGEVFFQWLKSHKDTISAEDMRNIKIKRSTVECATKRLGSSKEGQKQLLKLILDWVGQYQLRKKSEAAAAAAVANQFPCPYQGSPPPPQTFQNPNPNPNYNYSTHVPTADPNSCFSPQPWIPPAPLMQPFMADPTANVMSAPSPSFPYTGSADPYNSAMNCPNPYNHGEYQMLDSSQPWNQSHMTMAATSASQYPNPYPDMGHNLPPGMPLGAAYVAHDQQYPYPPMYAGNGDQMFTRLGASATKEARKKRMARQRRLAWNHHPRHHQQQQQQNQQNQANFENCPNQNQGNWGYWPPPPAVAASAVSTIPMMMPPQPMGGQPQARGQQADRSSMQAQNGHKQISPEKRQGWKSENLKFLLQKVLKQSDVGYLGRIVLPKKEAETHLPELETRDGISISMEDIGTSRAWNMRYRFWPKNKSRMYLLENTGDFVKANELQEGDFIVLYSDMKCGKYLIRGVKVRQPGTKPEGEKPAKRNQRNASQGGNGTPTSPIKKQQKQKQKQTGAETCN